MNRTIYLKSLIKGFQPDKKVMKLISDTIFNANGIEVNEKTKSTLQDSRKFILKNTAEFLNYAVDYSLADKFSGILKFSDE